MSKQIIPYKHVDASKRQQIEKMFNIISTKYDVLNRVISWGLDKRWRNNVLEIISRKKPDTLLDIATGTGEMAILLSRTGAKCILAIDTSLGMLTIANEKIQRKSLQQQIHTDAQDAENIKSPDNFFDAATITYGIRNFENIEKSLTETFRVLKPGGILVILETSVPSNSFLKIGYLFYTKRIIPKIASILSDDKIAYKYLAESAIVFLSPDEIIAILKEIGYHNISSRSQIMGISTIYSAEK